MPPESGWIPAASPQHHTGGSLEPARVLRARLRGPPNKAGPLARRVARLFGRSLGSGLGSRVLVGDQPVVEYRPGVVPLIFTTRQFGDRVEFRHMEGDIVAEFPSKEGSSYEWSAIYRKENGLWKIITADFG